LKERKGEREREREREKKKQANKQQNGTFLIRRKLSYFGLFWKFWLAERKQQGTLVSSQQLSYLAVSIAERLLKTKRSMHYGLHKKDHKTRYETCLH